LAADAEEAEVEKADGGCEGPLAGHPLDRDVALDGAAQARQGAGEFAHFLVLAGGAAEVPAVVVAVLLAAGFVVAGGLDVAERVGADPHIPPGGRDRQRADPG